MSCRQSLAVLICLLVPTLVFGQDRMFDSAGVSTRYVDHGTGEPVVLLHGRGNTIDLWLQPGRLQQLGLDADYRVIAFDASSSHIVDSLIEPTRLGPTANRHPDLSAAALEADRPFQSRIPDRQ